MECKTLDPFSNRLQQGWGFTVAVLSGKSEPKGQNSDDFL